MIKPYIIFIDGQDRCGKSSIVKDIFKDTGMIHNVIDRGPMSNMVYSKMYNRAIDTKLYKNILKDINIITIYLNPSIKTLKNRTITSKDFGVPIKQIKYHKKMFNNVYNEIKDFPNVFCINNSNLTIQQTIKKIVKIIKKMEGVDNEKRKNSKRI